MTSDFNLSSRATQPVVPVAAVPICLGSVRVTNMRVSMAPDAQPEEDESIVVIDRTNAILGNRHVLFQKSDFTARERVIRAYQADLERDIASNGPMSAEIQELADRVRGGERICLACWCKPSPCHGDILARKIFALASQAQKPASPIPEGNNG